MGHFDSGQYRVYFSGHESIWHRGVAFVVNRSVAMSVLGYETVNDRIITIRIQGRALNLTIIQVYAPTTEATESDIEDFYSSFQEKFDAAPSKDIKLQIGDFNAKVGCSIEPSITGSFGLGERNDAGDRLVELCAEIELTITNTLFKQPNRRLYTRTSPDGKSRNQIDYIICQRRWKSSVLSVKTRPGADCGTDHELLEAKLSVRFKKLKRQIKTIKLDDIPAEYAVAISNRLDALQLDNLTVDDRWEKLRSCVMKEAQKHIPVLERKQKKPWMSEKALTIARKRREAKSQHRKDFMKQFHREFKLQARKDKEEYPTEKCSEMESNYKHGRTRDCFTVIEVITGKFRPKYSGILDENKQLVSSGKEVKQRWKNYTEALYK